MNYMQQLLEKIENKKKEEKLKLIEEELK